MLQHLLETVYMSIAQYLETRAIICGTCHRPVAPRVTARVPLRCYGGIFCRRIYTLQPMFRLGRQVLQSQAVEVCDTTVTVSKKINRAPTF